MTKESPKNNKENITSDFLLSMLTSTDEKYDSKTKITTTGTTNVKIEPGKKIKSNDSLSSFVTCSSEVNLSEESSNIDQKGAQEKSNKVFAKNEDKIKLSTQNISTETKDEIKITEMKETLKDEKTTKSEIMKVDQAKSIAIITQEKTTNSNQIKETQIEETKISTKNENKNETVKVQMNLGEKTRGKINEKETIISKEVNKHEKKNDEVIKNEKKIKKSEVKKEILIYDETKDVLISESKKDQLNIEEKTINKHQKTEIEITNKETIDQKSSEKNSKLENLQSESSKNVTATATKIQQQKQTEKSVETSKPEEKYKKSLKESEISEAKKVALHNRDLRYIAFKNSFWDPLYMK